jgi:hypothetical protein
VRVRLERSVEIGVPAGVLWDYVTDWPRQAEWVPMTRVERVDAADGLGGRLRAWTGVGPLGFWDPMTITLWQRDADGGGRCEVLHRGRVVRGEGEFAVRPRGLQASTFVWAEVLVLPGGRLGALAFRLVRPALERALDGALRRLRDRIGSAPRPPSP